MENKILIKQYCRLKLDHNLVRRTAAEILIKHGLVQDVELSMVLMGKKRGQALNKHYRGKSYIPQMLEFPMAKIKDEEGVIRLGDILICVAKFREEMARFHKSEEALLTEWLEHGIGNLLQ